MPLKEKKDAKLELTYDVNMAGLSEQGESGDAFVTTGSALGY